MGKSASQFLDDSYINSASRFLAKGESASMFLSEPGPQRPIYWNDASLDPFSTGIKDSKAQELHLRPGSETIGPKEKLDMWDIITGLTPFVSDARDILETSTGKDIVTGEDLSAMDRAITGGAMAIPFVPGMVRRVFHGSPTKGIEKILFKYMGSGEGGQAFGWGSYLADVPEVAETYTDFGKSGSHHVSNWIDFKSKHPKAANMLAEDISSVASTTKLNDEVFGIELKNFFTNKGKHRYLNDDTIDEINKAVKGGYLLPEKPGQVYAVDIGFPGEDELLDWDKYLNEQPKSVRDNIKPLLKKIYDQSEIPEIEKKITGEDLYRDLSLALGSDESASKALNRVGIPGHRFLDQFSRKSGKGTHNYVIWNEDAMKVVK